MVSIIIGSEHVGQNFDVSVGISMRKKLPHLAFQRPVKTFDHARFDVFILTDVELHALFFQLFL